MTTAVTTPLSLYVLAGPSGKSLIVSEAVYNAFERMMRKDEPLNGIVHIEFSQGAIAGVRAVSERKYK